MKTRFYQAGNLFEIKEKYSDYFKNIELHNLIICYNGLGIVGYINYLEAKTIIIKNLYLREDLEIVFEHLFSKLNFLNYLEKEIIINLENYNTFIQKFNNYYFVEEQGKNYILKLKEKPKRFFKIGKYPTGNLNNLADVKGVKVGHYSLIKEELNTGITAIMPHEDNLFENKPLAASYVYNGFGKSIGLVQIDELGTIETPILLTNTLNVGLVSDGLIDYKLKRNPKIGISTGTINPIVLECNDGSLNDIRTRHLGSEEVLKAIKDAKTNFSQGAVGAGCGMTCHGFKGGIGSSSRIIKIDDKDYTIAVLVNSNFLGTNPKHLIVNNNYLGNILDNQKEPKADQGSIIIVVAIDIPLTERQLKRVCKRAVLGIAKTGGYASNGSGDLVVGFTTANIIKHYPENKFSELSFTHDNYISGVFNATVEAAEEAIINSLMYAKTTKGVRSNLVKSINEEIAKFEHLLIENHFESM